VMSMKQRNASALSRNRKGNRPDHRPALRKALNLESSASDQQITDAFVKLFHRSRPSASKVLDEVFGPGGDVPAAFTEAITNSFKAAEAALAANESAEAAAKYELERAALRNGAAASARNQEERTMDPYEITTEIKAAAAKLRRESPGVYSMEAAIKKVAPAVMEEAAKPKSKAAQHSSAVAGTQAEAATAMGIAQARDITAEARDYQRRMGEMGIRVSNAAAVNHVTGDSLVPPAPAPSRAAAARIKYLPVPL